MNAENSADWVIQRIEHFLEPWGSTWPADIADVLRTPVHSLPYLNRETVRECHDVGVAAIRDIVTIEKSMGVQTVRVRRGLRLPESWQHHYSIIYQSNLPWLVSGVLQSAFLGNPAAGERKKWKSP